MRLVALLFLLWTALPAWADGRQYKLDPAGSEVEFTYRLSGQAGRGTMPVVSADLVIDFAALERSQAEVALDVTGTRTNAVFVTQALKDESVLDASRYPTIQFRSKTVRGSLDSGAQIAGDVTIRGVTRPMVLQAQVFRVQGSDASDLSRLTVRLTGHINRADFGATGYPDLVADRVDLDITARLVER